MLLWYLNALRALLAVMIYSSAPLASCERVWDMAPLSHLPPGKTYEEWYGSFELDCSEGDLSHPVLYCYGSNC